MKTTMGRITLLTLGMASAMGAIGQNRISNGSFEVGQVTNSITSSPATGGLLDIDAWQIYFGGNYLVNKAKQTNGNACVELPPADGGLYQEFNLMPDRTSGRNVVAFDYGVYGSPSGNHNPIIGTSLYPTSGGTGKSDIYTAASVARSNMSYNLRSSVSVMDITDGPSGMARLDLFGFNTPNPVVFDNVYVFNLDVKPAVPVPGDFEKVYGFSPFNNTSNQGNLSSLRQIDDLRCRVQSDMSLSAGWLIAGYSFKPVTPTFLECHFDDVKIDWATGSVHQTYEIWNFTNKAWESLDSGGAANSYRGTKLSTTGKYTVGKKTGTSAQIANYIDPVTKLVLFRVSFGNFEYLAWPQTNTSRFQVSVDRVQIF